MLAGNADRERAVDVLRAAYAEGRLTKEEYDQRVERGLNARTVEELQLLTGDVPNGPGSVAPFQAPGTAAVAHHRPHPWAVPPYGPPYGAFGPMMPRPTNGVAIGALICGLLVPATMGLSGVPAVVLGHKALSEIRRTGERGDTQATIGLALGWLGLVVFVLLFVIF